MTTSEYLIIYFRSEIISLLTSDIIALYKVIYTGEGGETKLLNNSDFVSIRQSVASTFLLMHWKKDLALMSLFKKNYHQLKTKKNCGFHAHARCPH